MSKKRLKDVIIDRIDLVKDGDNRGADIVLYKNKGGGDLLNDINKAQWWMDVQTYFNLKGEDIMTLKEILGKLSDGEQQFLTKTLEDKAAEAKKSLEDKDTEAKKSLDAKDAEITKLKEELDTAKKALEAKVVTKETEDIWKGVNPDIKKAYDEITDKQKKSEDKQKKSEDELKKMKEDIRKSEFISKAKEFKGLTVIPEEFGPVLMKVADADDETYKKVFEALQAADKAVVESELFKEQGRGGGATPSGAYAKVTKMAEDMVAKSEGKVTIEAAKAKVIEDNPDLYSQYIKEREE